MQPVAEQIEMKDEDDYDEASPLSPLQVRFVRGSIAASS